MTTLTQQDIDLAEADYLLKMQARLEQLENMALERLRGEGKVESWPNGGTETFSREFANWWDCVDD